jgi:hypothetical protein
MASPTDQYKGDYDEEDMNNSNEYADHYGQIHRENSGLSEQYENEVNKEPKQFTMHKKPNNYDEELEKAQNRKYDSNFQLNKPELALQDSLDLLEMQREMGVNPEALNKSRPLPSTASIASKMSDTSKISSVAPSVQQSVTASEPAAQPPSVTANTGSITATTTTTTTAQPFPRPGYKLMGYPPVEVPITNDNSSQKTSQAVGCLQDSPKHFEEPEYPPTVPIEVSLPPYGEAVEYQQSSFEHSEHSLGYQESFDRVGQSLPESGSDPGEILCKGRG